MSWWKRIAFASLWAAGLMALTIGLAVFLAAHYGDRSWATTEAKYWFGVGFGVVLARYILWPEKFEDRAPASPRSIQARD